MANINRAALTIQDLLIVHDIDTTSPMYCHAEEYYDSVGTQPARPIGTPGEYEAELSGFIGGPQRLARAHNDAVLLVVGGVGSGKSTAVRRAVHTARVNTGVSRVVTPIETIEFDLYHAILPDDDLAPEAALEQMWRAIVAVLGRTLHASLALDLVTEIKEAWHWIVTRDVNHVHRFADLHRFFQEVGPIVLAIRDDVALGARQPTDLLEQLIESRKTLIRNLPPEQLAWFYMLLLSYRFRVGTASDRRPVVILDNVDHCLPEVQRAAYGFAVLVGDVLRARTLVTLRPMTRAGLQQGANFVREMPHGTPAVGQVVLARTEEAIRVHAKDLNDADAKATVALAQVLSGRGHPIISSIFRATSGQSARLALKNFVNMLSNPLLANIDESSGVRGLRPSILARALFFTGGSFNLDGFENLYVISGVPPLQGRLIKPRILHWLTMLPDRVARTRDIFSFCDQFGYSSNWVQAALDDLLRRDRPLLWSESGFRTESVNSACRLALTPLGFGYISTLFGELCYEECCLAANEYSDVPLSRTIEQSKILEEQDLEESRRFINRFGTLEYRCIYANGTEALTVVRARRIMDGVRNRMSELRGDERSSIDPRHENYVEREIAKLLS